MKRDLYYDSIKFLLICLVIIAHVFEIQRGNDKISTSLYNFIYLFHMPLFIFISGLFTKNIDKRKLISGNIKIMETYIIFQLFFYALIFFNKSNSLKIDNFLDVLIQPYFALWYLLSLVFWRTIIYFFRSIRPLPIIVLSIAISLLAGFHPSIGFELSLSKTLVYFPFFVLGHYCSTDTIEKIRKIPNYLSMSILAAALILSYIFLDDNTYKLITGGRSYYETGYSVINSFFMRSVTYPVSIVLGICIMSVIPVIEKAAFLGAKTLTFYVYHMLFLLPASIIYKKFETNLLIDITTSFIIIFMIIIMSKYKLFNILLNPISYFVEKNKSLNRAS